MRYNPTMHRLSNGLTVILDPMDAATTYVIVNFKTGSRDETPSEYGLTHFCEHMLCKGTRRFKTATDINDYVEDNAGINGACTSDEFIRLYGNIVAENTEKLLDVFADQLQNSVFDSDVLERERGIIADELRRNMDNPSRNKSEFVKKNIVPGNGVVCRTLGTFENIASFTKEQMKTYIARRMTAKNCVICISGRIDNPEKLLSLIDKKFGWLPSIDVPNNTAVPTYRPAVAHMSNQKKANTDLTVLVPQLYKLNLENRFRRMCVTRFESYLIKNLFQVLRNENGLVYGVGTEGFIVDGLGINGFSAQTAPDNIGRMVALMAQTAHKAMTTNQITDEFLKRYNNSCRLGDAMWLESPERRCKRIISNYMNYNGQLHDYYGIIKMAEGITANDVIENTRGYFDGPVSIISGGADYNADVLKIWNENFGNSPNAQTMMLIKDDKCH